MKRRSRDETRCLIDHVVGPRELGPAHALLSTSYELAADFMQNDFLPSLLGLSVRDDRSTRARIQLEEQLARLDAAAVLVDAEHYRERPQTLRLHVMPARARHGRMHAKVTLVVHEQAVRLIVGSANLTEAGYRSNREAVLPIVATAKLPGEAALVSAALAPMKEILQPWWSTEADRAWSSARELVGQWASEGDSQHDCFVWSDPTRPLWRRFVEHWPAGERVEQVRIVSPFWSAEGPEGPLTRLLHALRQRGSATDGAEITLFARAQATTNTGYVPELDASFADFDFSSLGVDAGVFAVDPEAKEDGFERDARPRDLHAKVVLLDGPNTTLAYLGSANFTVPGWGFSAQHTNIEAGVVLRREGRQRKTLHALIPPTTGPRQPLRGGATLTFVRPPSSEAAWDWPGFLRAVELTPDDTGDRLRLLARLQSAELPSSFRLFMADHAARTLVLAGDSETRGDVSLQLSGELVSALLRQKHVLVEWDGMRQPKPVAFPVNVSGETREHLPFSDAGQLPGEAELIAYYQGRISLEDMFGGEEPELRNAPAEYQASAGSYVDTSSILSYQIRDFVEALHGIGGELERGTGTTNGVRLAFLGPVSPVALARTVEREVSRGRSPVAGAFQLAELLSCIHRAREPRAVSAQLAVEWRRARAEAEALVAGLLENVTTRHPALSAGAQFQRYRAMLDALREASS